MLNRRIGVMLTPRACKRYAGELATSKPWDGLGQAVKAYVGHRLGGSIDLRWQEWDSTHLLQKEMV